MAVFIGGAWPYANGSLHLGRVASILPGDIVARYFRLTGEDVLYVSGSDCHGTPISIQAHQEGMTPDEIADRYHHEFTECFQKLGFSYDVYGRTDDPRHHRIVQELFRQLADNGHIYNKSVDQLYCPSCERFLPDRYVEGTCPHCDQVARGDQCDFCSALLDPFELHDPKCKICRTCPVARPTTHGYLALSQFQSALEGYFAAASPGWKVNAIELTKRYLGEGLYDRAATRDLSWGIDVPLVGFEGKKIYVWIEAVLGYVSASNIWAEETGGDWEKFWSAAATAYYVHGKDNIPFHTIILPALLLGIGGLHLPDRILSSEHLTLEGKKFSTSRHWAVWVPSMLERYHPDSIRYFLTINGPEQRDANFSWREFIYSHNGELLGAFGNFVNRNMAFLEKYYAGEVPESAVDGEVRRRFEALYVQVGELIEAGRMKSGLEAIFAEIRASNKYLDERKPWQQIKDNRMACNETIYTCVQIIANLSNLLEPFLPFTCEKIRAFLGLSPARWEYAAVPGGRRVQAPEHLFQRIDPDTIQEEVERLKGGA
jgi:methionyl-tRNA synthetase